MKHRVDFPRAALRSAEYKIS